LTGVRTLQAVVLFESKVLRSGEEKEEKSWKWTDRVAETRKIYRAGTRGSNGTPCPNRKGTDHHMLPTHVSRRDIPQIGTLLKRPGLSAFSIWDRGIMYCPMVQENVYAC
jgi:hypothetical protein